MKEILSTNDVDPNTIYLISKDIPRLDLQTCLRASIGSAAHTPVDVLPLLHHACVYIA